MRDHIRREAGSYDASWWLVPTAFALVALVAVATIDADDPSPVAAPQLAPRLAAQPAAQPAVMPAVLSVTSPAVQPAALPPAPTIEVTEHVQAF